MPRSAEIWDVAKKAASMLGLHDAGIDFVVGDLPRAVDVNARPMTSIIGIAKVTQEEIGELIVRARFGGLPDRLEIHGEVIFRKEELI
jgi:predicted ATP-grasp superfamily ATP-dependent carboligase